MLYEREEQPIKFKVEANSDVLLRVPAMQSSTQPRQILCNVNVNSLVRCFLYFALSGL